MTLTKAKSLLGRDVLRNMALLKMIETANPGVHIKAWPGQTASIWEIPLLGLNCPSMV